MQGILLSLTHCERLMRLILPSPVSVSHVYKREWPSSTPAQGRPSLLLNPKHLDALKTADDPLAAQLFKKLQ